MSKCNHKYETILKCGNIATLDDVIRWCSRCGAIRGDYIYNENSMYPGMNDMDRFGFGSCVFHTKYPNYEECNEHEWEVRFREYIGRDDVWKSFFNTVCWCPKCGAVTVAKDQECKVMPGELLSEHILFSKNLVFEKIQTPREKINDCI